METLVLDGRTYVKASKAAEALGYTSDYVGQLCRTGKVEAHLVGRSWYVSEKQLGKHRAEKKRMSRVKARKQVKAAIEEHQKKRTYRTTQNQFEDRHITYEEDTHELIPTVKKLAVDSEAVKTKKRTQKTKKNSKKEPNYTIENEGDKILMSGTVNVVDATDEDALDEDTVFLEAHIDTKKHKKLSPKTQARAKKSLRQMVVEEEVGAHEEAVTVTVPEKPPKSDFLAKLEALNTLVSEDDGESIPIEHTEPPQTSSAPKQAQKQKTSTGVLFLQICVVLLGLFFVAASVIVESSWTYVSSPDGASSGVPTQYGVDIRSILDKIPY